MDVFQFVVNPIKAFSCWLIANLSESNFGHEFLSVDVNYLKASFFNKPHCCILEKWFLLIFYDGCLCILAHVDHNVLSVGYGHAGS